MAFAIFVEALNLAAAARRRKRTGKAVEPVHLHIGYTPEEEAGATASAPKA